MPTAFQGLTREESKASCRGCVLLRIPDGGLAESGRPMCYSHYGLVALAHAQLIQARRDGLDCSLDAALNGRLFSARYMRLGAIGDTADIPVSLLRRITAKIRASGLGVLNYTHQWKDRRRKLQGLALASCDTLAEVDQATEDGYRCAVILPADHDPRQKITTPAGLSVTVCPYQAKKWAGRIPPQCNDCGLCDPEKPIASAIGFIDSGPTARGGK